VRTLAGSSSNAEGWAHYNERMMLDESYSNGDLKLRLGQLRTRCCATRAISSAFSCTPAR
jgi:uncharacterized protein (DUF885 family)